MKKKLLLCGALAMAFCCNAQIPSYIPTGGLVAWYPFNGNVLDESGNGHDGIISGNLVSVPDRNNQPNAAFYFNQANMVGTDGIAIPYDATLSIDTGLNKQITISVWFYQDSLLSIGIWGELGKLISSKIPGNSYEVDFTIFHEIGNTIWGTGMSADPCSWQGISTPANHQWHQYVVTLNQNITSVTGVKEIYVDGTLIASCNYNYKNPANLDSLKIGTDGFMGMIDDIGVWNRVLTTCEIQQLFSSSTLPFISQNPQDIDTTVGSTISFTVTTPDTGVTYLWQMDNGTGFQNLTNAGQYSGTTTDTLTISNLTLGNNNQHFRCVLTNGCTDTSTAALLTVNDPLSIYPIARDGIITLYPNPVHNELLITYNYPDRTNYYTIVDITGKIEITGELTHRETSIDMSKLVSGLYILRIPAIGYTQKFMKH